MNIYNTDLQQNRRASEEVEYFLAFNGVTSLEVEEDYIILVLPI